VRRFATLLPPRFALAFLRDTLSFLQRASFVLGSLWSLSLAPLAMADALCGPSNALQNFQKHTSVDRTLQQDRLVGRHSPAQVSQEATEPSIQADIM
jgi:hypothetical protein